MTSRNILKLMVLGEVLAVGGCAMPAIPVPDFAGATHAAHQSADAVGDTADSRMPGMSDAIKAPLHDLNLTRDDIPTVLVRAYARPYDTVGLTSCKTILDQVSALDLALGPDVDIPRSANADEDMFAKGRGLAGDAALDAVRSATTGVIPVRSWVRRFSGASRAEQELKAIVLAGSVRRGFLKAMGAQQQCEWPAAPLNLQRAALKVRALTPAEKTAIGDTPKETVAAGTAAPTVSQR